MLEEVGGVVGPRAMSVSFVGAVNLVARTDVKPFSANKANIPVEFEEVDEIVLLCAVVAWSIHG
eukprot:11934339-Prorocentrum_lima.AAC.1